MDNMMSIIENAIQTGHPVLLQDIMEEIDPSLEPVLVKAFVVRSGKVWDLIDFRRLYIRLMKNIYK
jgi:dynein heavy chain